MRRTNERPTTKRVSTRVPNRGVQISTSGGDCNATGTTQSKSTLTRRAPDTSHKGAFELRGTHLERLRLDVLPVAEHDGVLGSSGHDQVAREGVEAAEIACTTQLRLAS